MNSTVKPSKVAGEMRVDAPAASWGMVDAELVSRLKNGEEQAFETLVRQFGGRMLSVARRLCPREHDAEDAVQEAFVAAFKSINTFEGTSQLWTWLHRVVTNACLMKLRSQRRAPAVSMEDVLPAFDDTGHQVRPAKQWSDDAIEQASASEMRELIRACIDRLPESYRTVLLLRDIQELNTEETAEILGCTIGNVKTRLHRARQALRTLLEPKMAQAQ